MTRWFSMYISSLNGSRGSGTIYLRTDNHNEDNTVGSCPTKEERAYIAGFLDGDGSLMLQLKKRTDTKKGLRMMVTICFYQDSRHDKPLGWIRQTFGIGYLSQRNDGMTELRINGYAKVRSILEMLAPYIRFKKIQTGTIISACKLLERKSFRMLTSLEKKKLCEYAFRVQENNYRTRKKRTLEEFYRDVGLTP